MSSPALMSRTRLEPSVSMATDSLLRLFHFGRSFMYWIRINVDVDTTGRRFGSKYNGPNAVGIYTNSLIKLVLLNACRSWQPGWWKWKALECLWVDLRLTEQFKGFERLRIIDFQSKQRLPQSICDRRGIGCFQGVKKFSLSLPWRLPKPVAPMAICLFLG